MSSSNQQLTSLHDFFSSPCLLTLPAYQRQYSWEVPQFEDLWNDLFYLEYGKRYFFGTIFMKILREETSGQYQTYEVIDGQQRLATVLMLVRTVLDELRSLGHVDFAELQFSERRYFTVGGRHKLQLQGIDDLIFQGILEGTSESVSAATASQKRLWIARNYFRERLREQKRALIDDARYENFLREFMKKALALEVMRHIVETDDEAVMIFESVNDRGISLSSLDKTKSFLMRYLYLCSRPAEMESNLKLVNNVFASIFASVQDCESERLRGQLKSQKEFEKEIQRVHYITFKAGATYFSDAFSSLKEELFSMYRKDRRDPDACARSVMDYAASLERAFSSMAKMLLYSDNDETQFWLDRIYALNHSTYLPLLLSGWMTLSENRREDLLTLLRAIECLEFRYSSFRSRRSYTLLERIGARALDLYHGNQDLSSVLSSLNYLIKHYASDGAFRADLESENFYFGSKSAMKLLFYEWECHLRTLQGKTMDIPLNRWMSSDYQVDHVWAQQSLGGGSDYQEYLECGNKMGNLVVVPLQTNVAMSNMHFTHKKIPYRESNLETLKVIAEAPHWRQLHITKRTTELANFAMHRWSTPNERAEAKLLAQRR